MINHNHLRLKIIRPVLENQLSIGFNGRQREELLIITAAQESLGGYWLEQINASGLPVGPAQGIYQMEPATHDDLYENFLKFHKLLWGRLTGSESIKWDASRLVWDLKYATGCAALQYYRFPEKIPDDLDGQIDYYKRHWNTAKGAADVAEVKKNYLAYVGK